MMIKSVLYILLQAMGFRRVEIDCNMRRFPVSLPYAMRKEVLWRRQILWVYAPRWEAGSYREINAGWYYMGFGARVE